MKKTLSLLALAASVLCACDKNADCIPFRNRDSQVPAQLNISLDFEDDSRTRAVTAYTAAQGYEIAVNNVQVLVFDESGKINIYKDVDKATSDISVSTTAGTKTVWAVVNGPDLSAVATLSALEETAVELADNSVDKAEGFVMAGYVSCTLTSGGAEAEVAVSRLVSRVALQKVTNALAEGHGALKVDHVTLINVPGNQNLKGSASISAWYNRMGRKDGGVQTAIIDGSSYPASCPTLTFAAPAVSVSNGADHIPSTPYLFYCYPNPTTTDSVGWSESFSERKTRLVLAATIAGVRYYYPVTIDTPERNKTYTVELTITGLGSTDPDHPVSKGVVAVSVTVKDWETGASYEEII